MSLFFALLPEDLHIGILQTWVGLGLSALSALDAAFCSRADRPHFLVCLQLACRHRTEAIGKKRKVSTRHFLIDCLSWMAARGIPVVEVKLTLATKASSSTSNYQITDLAAILALAPHMKRIGYVHRAEQVSHWDWKQEDEDLLLWQALTAGHLNQLEELSFDVERTHSMDAQVTKRSFQVIGSRLKVLHIIGGGTNGTSLLRMLTRHCKVLETLQSGPRYGEEVVDYVDLVRSLTHLSSLTIYCIFITARQAQQILQAGPQLRTLVMDRCRVEVMEFVTLLQEFPHLGELSVEGCAFSKNDQHLLMAPMFRSTTFTVNELQWEQAIVACPAVLKLTTTMKMIGRSAGTLGAAYGTSMRELTLQSTVKPSELPLLQTLLSHCPHITHISIAGDGAHADNLIEASACANLQSLILTGHEAFPGKEEDLIEDAHMDVLLDNCPHLHSVSISPAKVTKGALEAILRRRMVFKTIAFDSRSAISQADVAWFRAQAKKLQLLPLPVCLFS